MTEQVADVVRKPVTRTTGVVYLLYFLTAIGAEFCIASVVSDNAAMTAGNILAHPSLFQLGLAGGLVSTAFYVALTGLLYRLFEPANKTVSMIAALFSVVGCAVLALANIFRAAPLALLHGGFPTGYAPEQSQRLMLFCFDLHRQCIEICFVFFGVYCTLIGYLIAQSRLLPRVLGLWMMLAGLGWLIFLAPPLAHRLSSYIVAFGFAAELVLMLWLLLAGVKVQPSPESERL